MAGQHVAGAGSDVEQRGDPGEAPRAAVLMAHPGHELRIHGWIERARPLAFVLTDGSGSGTTARLASSASVLERAGARPADLFGRYSDRALYAAVLSGDAGTFLKLADEILEAWLDERIGVVAADALEGFNPSHDLCRHLADAVVSRLRARGRAIASLAFPLAGAPDLALGPRREDALHLALDDAALARKLAAARSYDELHDEVKGAFAAHGLESFRHEWLWPAPTDATAAAASADPPFYERRGELRRAAGVYTEVLRRREHVAPIARALAAWGDAG